MMKVCTLVGTRPEIIKLSEVIKLLDRYTDHTLIHTGQHYDYELHQVFFEDLKLRSPDISLEASGSSAIETISQSLVKFDEILGSRNFDCVLVYGDTNSSLCTYAAKRRKIPIFHMEAGNRCFDERVPEEINRKIIDHLADVNLVITEHARRNLLSEGIHSQYVFKVGSSMAQVLAANNLLERDRSGILYKLNLTRSAYYLLSIHREENIENPKYMHTLSRVVQKLSETFPVVMPMHPKTSNLFKKHYPALQDEIHARKIILAPPFGFVDYIALQRSSYCTLSDSGTIFEESDLLGFPAVTIRDSFERPEGLDNATLIVSDWNLENIQSAIQIAVETRNHSDSIDDYESFHTAQKVVKIIMSLTPKVRIQKYYSI